MGINHSIDGMKKYVYPIIVSAVVIVYILAVMNQTPNTAIAEKNNQTNTAPAELFITGSATKSLKPDKASIILTVEIDGKTASEATDKNAEIMVRVVDVLHRLGIKDDEISTNYYNLSPIYVSKRSDNMCITIYPPPPECMEQILIGYKVINSINVIVDANSNLGKIIDESVSAGVNRVDYVSFFVSQELQDKITNELIEQAVNDAKSKAERALQPLNMSIIGVKSISVGYYPIPIFQESYRASGAVETSTPIFPSQQQISVSVNVTFLVQ